MTRKVFDSDRKRAEKKLEYERKAAFVRAYKAERGCSHCGERDVRCLDLHHKDPLTKHPKLKPLRGRAGMTNLSYAQIHEELPKCDVLCANCHRKEPYVPHGKEWLSFRDKNQLALDGMASTSTPLGVLG